MEIRNIAVALDAEAVDADLVALACDLARANNATLIGVAAAEPPLVMGSVNGGDVVAAIYAEQREQIEETLSSAARKFADLVPTGITHRWVQDLQRPEVTVVDTARAADLIIVASRAAGPKGSGRIDVDAVLLGAGRPVLVAAQGDRQLKADKIVVAWKDTKEARRAVVDALPLLKAAQAVSVVVVDEGNLATERASMQDAVAWLVSHDVEASGDVLPDTEGPARTIAKAAADAGAGLVVGGAYGHSRLRQWLLGGMTRDLLATPGLSLLLSN